MTTVVLLLLVNSVYKLKNKVMKTLMIYKLANEQKEQLFDLLEEILGNNAEFVVGMINMNREYNFETRGIGSRRKKVESHEILVFIATEHIMDVSDIDIEDYINMDEMELLLDLYQNYMYSNVCGYDAKDDEVLAKFK